MLRSTLKRNLFPIALISLGGLICLAIILYVFRAYLPMLGWVLFGLLMIGIGVIGIVASNPKNRTRAGDEPSRPSQAPPGTSPPPIMAPKSSSARPKKNRLGQQDTITLSKPVLIGGGVLLVSLVLVLLCNFGVALRSLLTVHKTQIVDCREASLYAEEGWRFVSSYSYRLEDEVSGYTEHTDCVMEREQFVWAKDKRISKDNASTDDASTDDASSGDESEDDASMDDASMSDASTDGVFSGDDAGILNPTPYLMPTQTHSPQSSATQIPRPTSTVGAVSSPLPTSTPPPLSASGPTATPLSLSSAPSSNPHADIDVCEAIENDAYLDAYVQWKGTIIDAQKLEEEELWFQVQWTNADASSECSQATFFVSYDGTDRFYEEDMVTVTGTIIDTYYKYEGESGQTELSVVVKADNIEFFDDW